MGTLVQLPVLEVLPVSTLEVLPVSTEVSGYLHNQTRKRRIPIVSLSIVPEATTNAVIVSSTTLDASVNVGYLRKLYACPSGRAKATLDHGI